LGDTAENVGAAMMPENTSLGVVINLITHNSKTNEVTLVLVETERWGGNGEHLQQLRRKLDSYVQFVLSGQFARDYPVLAGKRVRFRVDCHHPVGTKEVAFLYKYRAEELETRGIQLEIHEVGVRSFLKRSFRR
jgi:hypothetical protein